MKNTIGILLQILVLACLPLIILYQLQFQFHILMMPIALTVGICVFGIGTMLREAK